MTLANSITPLTNVILAAATASGRLKPGRASAVIPMASALVDKINLTQPCFDSHGGDGGGDISLNMPNFLRTA